MFGKGFGKLESMPLKPSHMAQEQIDSLEKKAREYLAHHEIKLDDFIDLYGENNIGAHQQYVLDTEQKFPEENQETKDNMMVGTIFEAIFLEHGEQSNWLGSSTEIIKTSRYDDLKNGVDAIAEIVEEDKTANHLALAIDVTFTTHAGNIDKKLERIRQEIIAGTMAEIKYFKSDHLKMRGELKQVPRVIVGVDKKTVIDLARLWDGGSKKELAAHDIQFQILEEIILQLETYKNYANKVGRPDLVVIYDRAMRIAQEIYAERNTELTDVGERDRGFQAIKNGLTIFS